jgi:transcriptional regulator with XRE-family HTH domain
MKYIGDNIDYMTGNTTVLGQWIRENLKEKGRNQAWLAERISVQPPQVSRIISGESEATTDMLNAIADALGKPRIQIYRAAGHIEPATTQDELDEAILHHARRLPLDERERWVKRLESDADFYEQRRTNKPANKTRT